MSDSRFLCTTDNRQGIWPNPGMLGRGYATFPYETPAEFHGGPNIGGYYAIDDYHTALVLAHELADPNVFMDEDEALEKANLLHDLIQALQRGGRLTLEQLSTLQKAAQGIPVIGPQLFTPTSLPGTMVTLGSMAAATSMNKPTHQLLDLTKARKKALLQWSRARGKARVQAARTLSQGRVRLVTLHGKRYLNVPVTARASHYLVGGGIPGSTLLVPADSARASLMRKAVLGPNGATGALRMATGTTAGAVLAVVPQGIVDSMNATGLQDFLRRSSYSQPTNIATVVASAIGARIPIALLGSPLGATASLVVVLGFGLLSAFMAQNLLSNSGFNDWVGDYVWVE